MVQYLHERIDPNSKRSEHDERLSPHYVSTTAQIAIWKSQNGLWEVEQRGRWNYIVVQSDDQRLLLELALRWG